MLLTIEDARQEIVARCCYLANRAGIFAGTSLAEARGLCPEAEIFPLDRTRSLQALEKLALWMNRYSPRVAVDDFSASESPAALASGLLLDVTGLAHLWGGEQLLLAEIALKFRRAGIFARLAIAPSIGGGWALSHFGPPIAIVAAEQLQIAIAPLPIAALRVPSKISAQLALVGVEKVEHLLAISRESLMARFGDEILRRLDQLFGRTNEDLIPVHEEIPLAIYQAFEGAVSQLEAVLLATENLVKQLCEALAERECGVRGLRVELDRIELAPAACEILLGRPSRDPRHLWALLHPKLAAVNLGYGVEIVTVTATWRQRIFHGQNDMWQSTTQDAGIDELLDTLINRWGARRVLRPEPAPSHVPEQSRMLVPIEAGETEFSTQHSAWLDRPSRLLERPEPASVIALQPDHPPSQVQWRGSTFAVLAGAGPERIVIRRSPRGADSTRDYFKIQLDTGQWIWLFRNIEENRWYVHGLWA